MHKFSRGWGAQMTSTTRDLDQLLAEQNEQYARFTRELADRKREQQEEEREFAEWEEDEARREREHIDALRAIEQAAERKNRWLRGIGYPTRTIVFLVVLALLWWWFAPTDDFRNRAIGGLTLKEIAGLLGFVCALIMWVRLFVDWEKDGIDWEPWGVFGLWASRRSRCSDPLVGLRVAPMSEGGIAISYCC